MKFLIKLLTSVVTVFVITINLIIMGLVAVVHAAVSYTLDSIPAFSEYAWVYINNNVPDFTPEQQTMTESFETYSSLDDLGRCGPAFALVAVDLMPTEDRGAIGSVTPTGWVQVKYETSVVEGGYLYNRCHLIGYQLTGENANKLNLITGTRYLNIDGMLGFENQVADYVKKNDGHVLYRVTPIFTDYNLLADGVLMEGFSTDDSGKEITFCVFAYNAQPGITIDYKTGSSRLTVEVVVDIDGKRYVYIPQIVK